MADPVELYDEADKLKDEGKLDEAVAKFKKRSRSIRTTRWPTRRWRSCCKSSASTKKRSSTRRRSANSSRTIRSASPRSA